MEHLYYRSFFKCNVHYVFSDKEFTHTNVSDHIFWSGSIKLKYEYHIVSEPRILGSPSPVHLNSQLQSGNAIRKSPLNSA